MMTPIEAAIRDATEDYKLMRKSTRKGVQISPREYAARTQKLISLVAHNPATVKQIHKKDQRFNYGSYGAAIGAAAGVILSKGNIAKTLGATLIGGVIGTPVGSAVGARKAKKMLMDTNLIYHTPGAAEHLTSVTYKKDINTLEAQKRKLLRHGLL